MTKVWTPEDPDMGSRFNPARAGLPLLYSRSMVFPAEIPDGQPAFAMVEVGPLPLPSCGPFGNLAGHSLARRLAVAYQIEADFAGSGFTSIEHALFWSSNLAPRQGQARLGQGLMLVLDPVIRTPGSVASDGNTGAMDIGNGGGLLVGISSAGNPAIVPVIVKIACWALPDVRAPLPHVHTENT